jgi:hypothetical protein
MIMLEPLSIFSVLDGMDTVFGETTQNTQVV